MPKRQDISIQRAKVADLKMLCGFHKRSLAEAERQLERESKMLETLGAKEKRMSKGAIDSKEQFAILNGLARQ